MPQWERKEIEAEAEAGDCLHGSLTWTVPGGSDCPVHERMVVGGRDGTVNSIPWLVAQVLPQCLLLVKERKQVLMGKTHVISCAYI